MRLLIYMLALLLTQSISVQNTKIDQFYSLFTEIEFDVLHVYPDGRHPGEYTPKSTYPFKGVHLDTSFNDLLKSIITPLYGGFTSSSFYAVNKFSISENVDALLLREFIDGGMESHIHYVLFENKKKEFIHWRKIVYGYGYEGAFGIMESWIIDLNHDGFKDILTRSSDRHYLGRDAFEVIEDSIHISLWNKNELISFPVTDSVIIKQLEVDFPFYEKPYVGSAILSLPPYISDNLFIEDIDKWNTEDLILNYPEEDTQELLSLLEYQKQLWKGVNSPITATYKGSLLNDYLQLIFEDENGKEFDFGFGNNTFGNYPIFDGTDANPDFVGKTFKIYWNWIPAIFPCCSGDFVEAKAYYPSIVKLELLED